MPCPLSPQSHRISFIGSLRAGSRAGGFDGPTDQSGGRCKNQEFCTLKERPMPSAYDKCVAHCPPVPYLFRMNRPIIPVTLPEAGTPAAALQPYSPQGLNALNDAQRQSPEIKEFSRCMHNSGGEHVTWLLWHYRETNLWTPPFALQRQGSMFFLDCGRGPFAVQPGTSTSNIFKTERDAASAEPKLPISILIRQNG